MELWHVTIATVDRMPLFADEKLLRAALQRLAKVSPQTRVMFSGVDEHLHDLQAGPRDEVGRIAQASALALRPWVSHPLAPARFRRIEGRRHLGRTVPYLLKQPRHHRLTAHPAQWSGSCFADLVGARCIAPLGVPLEVLLPRFRRAELWEAVGLPRGGVQPASDARLRSAGASAIAAAAAAAACADPKIVGRERPVVRARRAVAHAAQQVGITPADVAWALGISTRGARALQNAAPDPELLHAIRLRIAIDDAVQTLSRRSA